jgi:urea carboxylase
MLRWNANDHFDQLTFSHGEYQVPVYSHDWHVGVLYGPHGAPDFFTEEDIEMIFNASWKVHYNSDRTGVRLIGPRPKWARKDGGEAGLHPSNIHDNAYAIGALDFTGDMPILLGPDGPSLGGFVCPLVVAHDELWKLGQLRPDDTVRFALREGSEKGSFSPVLHSYQDVIYRASGDRYLLIEVGPNVLDLNLRFRVHQLEMLLRQQNLPGIIDITPGIRSLQIHYNSGVLRREELISCLEACDQMRLDVADLTLPTRTVHLPLSWDDPATQLAIRKYMQSVRSDAPWCPSNIEFIRRINGLDSVEDVRQIVFNANYLVLGLGDVYLGAPVATPLDPRHRLVTTKYNPARTWTAENSVGIGGAYLCVYGMEGPGGYQFVGRTVQMWNTHRTSTEFTHGTPWLLRFFDQIRFFPVSADELLEMRDAFPQGKYSLHIEHSDFSVRRYGEFLGQISGEAEDFKKHQQAAFLAERERWRASNHPELLKNPADDEPRFSLPDIPDGCEAVRSPMTASVWQIAVEPGQRVGAGERVIVLEAMKMEFIVVAPVDGIVETVHCARGGIVMAGQNLATLRPHG